MSYGVGLHFKHVESEAEVLDLMYNLQQEYNKKTNVIELLEENKHWLLTRYSQCKKLKLVDGTCARSPLFNYFMQDLFTFRFYYWKQYKLVALCYQSNPLPPHLEKYFDGYIYFQDSCDRNYDYKEWDVLGGLATPFITKVKSMTPNEIYAELYTWEPDDEEDIIQKKDYYEKTLVYELVAKALDIQNVLWLGKTDVFKYFEITKSFNDDNYEISEQVIAFLEKLNKKI